MLSSDPRMDSHFHALMNTYDYEDALFRIDPDLKDYRDIKELYIQLNSRNSGKPIEARKELFGLIRKYQEAENEMFRDFAFLLAKYEYPIINSLWLKRSDMEKSMTAVYPITYNRFLGGLTMNNYCAFSQNNK